LSSRLALPAPPSAVPRRRASARWPPFDTAAAHLLALAVWRSFADLGSSSHKQARLRESKQTSVASASPIVRTTSNCAHEASTLQQAGALSLQMAPANIDAPGKWRSFGRALRREWAANKLTDA